MYMHLQQKLCDLKLEKYYERNILQACHRLQSEGDLSFFLIQTFVVSQVTYC